MQDLGKLVDTAPLGEDGLVHPANVMPDATNDMRLMAVYSHALKLPVLALSQSLSRGEALELHVVVGEVGRPRAHQRQLAELKETLEKGAVGFYAQQAPVSVEVEVRVEPSSVASPVFDVADAFAGVARHYYLNQAFGEQMYERVRPVFERLPSVSQRQLAHGITNM